MYAVKAVLRFTLKVLFFLKYVVPVEGGSFFLKVSPDSGVCWPN